MSGGSALRLAEAVAVAEQLVGLLEPACERIEIAGSIRRRMPEVHDIELVAISRREPVCDIWGNPVPGKETHLLEGLVADLQADGSLSLRDTGAGQRNGPAYKALRFRGVPVDLFIVRPPAQWGVIFALRTGPGDWNKRLVTECQAFGRRVKDGQLWVFGKAVPTPEEEDFFREIGQPWVPPHERAPERVQLGWRSIAWSRT